MRVFVGILGVALILIILGDAFETIILPRRVTRRLRLTAFFYRYSWLAWRGAVLGWRDRKRRERVLGYYGPLSLIFLLMLWAGAIIVGFAAIQWGLHSPLVGNESMSFALDLYFSGTTFFTLGLGDVHPATIGTRVLTVLECGMGLGFLALVIGYLPVIYQGFSAREVNISLLDARAGSPPTAAELLRRSAESQSLGELDQLLRAWELWAAQLLESHISYPVLTLFRSQHDNQSWISALTTMLDTCALLLVGVRGAPTRQAQLTFAMARHAVVDLAQILRQPPQVRCQERLPHDDLEHVRAILAANGADLTPGAAAEKHLAELRHMYEPYVCSMAEYLVVELPDWFRQDGRPDNWQTSAWERAVRRVDMLEFDDHA